MSSSYDRNNPYLATITERVVLNKEGSKKVVKHLVIDLADSGITYSPGDSIGVIPTNDLSLVEKTLASLNITGDVEVEVRKLSTPTTAIDAFLHYITISRVTKKLATLTAEKQTDTAKKEMLLDLLQKEKAPELKQYLEQYHVWDFLEEHPQAGITAQDLCDTLLPLCPRLYSVASSQSAVDNTVHLAVALVEYTTNDTHRYGVCSHYLCNLAKINEPALPLFVHEARNFGVPEDLSAPIIMVGPGTGIAPFRGFIQDRIVRNASGGNWLFFGDWQREYDFVYEEEWQDLEQQGKLRVSTAFSRDQEYKIYVQDRIRDNGEDLWRWLEEGAYFYVCGDAARMARDVDAALHEVVQQYGARSEEEAAAYVAALKDAGRYQRDVY